ncbi:hypothetical protein BMS3Bbin07_00788 [bacterium BMS3Bbin07]|nr:hypothetical protein BMS3Bbin07_00788 [bacterium BMS3Bbin07]
MQLVGICKHLRHGNKGCYLLVSPGLGLHALNLSPLCIQVSDNRAKGVIRCGHLNPHNGFKQYRFCLGCSLFYGHGACNLKRHLRGINGVIRAVKERNLYIHHGITCQCTRPQGLYNSFLYCRDILPRNHATDYPVNKLKSSAPWQWFYLNPAVSILSPSA